MIHPTLRAMFTESDHKYDPWGSGIQLMFAVCDVMFANGVPVPYEWEFKPGWGQGDIDPDDYLAAWMDDELEAGNVTGEDLIHFGNVLGRYTRIMDTAGRSY